MSTDHLIGKIERGGSQVAVGDGHAPSGGAGPVERTFMVRPVLPCVTCDHAEVCSIRPKLEAAAGNFRPPMSPDPAVTIAVKATITCTFYRAGRVVPAEPRGTMGSSPEAPGFRRAVSEDDRIKASSQRGAAASKAARAPARPPTAPQDVAAAPKRAAWSDEQRQAARDRQTARWVAKREAATR